MSKKNNIAISGNIIIEKNDVIIDKINKLNSGVIVEVDRRDLVELSGKNVLSPVFNNSDLFLAGVRGFCFFPERPIFIEKDIPQHFSKYSETAIYNTTLDEYVEFFDFGRGYLDHHINFVKNRFVSFDSVDFLAFSAYNTNSGPIFLDLVFVDELSCFTTFISSIRAGESSPSVVFNHDYMLGMILDGKNVNSDLSSTIFKTLTSCLISLISMDYRLFCSDLSVENINDKLNTQKNNFEKIVKNDLMCSGLLDEKIINEVTDGMFSFFSKVVIDISKQ